MNATPTQPAPVQDIQPGVLYGLKDFCRFWPARRGGRLSLDVARRWAAQGRFGFMDIAPPGAKRKQYATYGRHILGALGEAEKGAAPEREPTPAERRQGYRVKLQGFVDKTYRKPFYSAELKEWFHPRPQAEAAK